ncbi:MAG: hypothetical protein Q8S47_14675 [Phenylobacterium sp.]|uniref:DUF6880 family protein n=1 Tax=Phenylobacterium sp. TaxID=1871053 RepID=UPI00272FC953|nr:DUF6880 family protein [Phenylobacterium sp.]MDP1617293.1 hypothetical protein [Phenylobacterium sp.]MDP1989221.1 hypothetical protein [Phenylobacterium sp.]MDP3384552.1 hypothetical protein [Phenylobacterium sp.]
MVRRAPSGKKVLSEANLASLGAERLAALLMETASPALKRRLRMELAAEVGAADLAFELDKRLTALEVSRTRVSWRKRPELLAELRTLNSMIVERLAALEPALALDRLVAWFDLYPSLTRRVQDPKGELALIFDSASGDLTALASKLGPEIAGPTLGEALSTRLSEWAVWVGRGAEGLSPALARRLLSDLTQGREKPTGRLALVVRRLADRAGDLDAWILSLSEAEQKKPEVGAEIARRLAQAGQVAAARQALEAARTSSPGARPAPKASAPEPQPESWYAAEIAVLEAEGDVEAADAARWRLFERTLSEDALRALLAKLADFEDVVALDRAFEIAAGHGDLMKALAFLIDWPAHREAAALVLKRRSELRGSWNDLPAWAERLSARHPQAALLLVRARAMALLRLGAGFTEEVQQLIAEAEVLAVGLSDPDIPGHETFLADLRQR